MNSLSVYPRSWKTKDFFGWNFDFSYCFWKHLKIYYPASSWVACISITIIRPDHLNYSRVMDIVCILLCKLYIKICV